MQITTEVENEQELLSLWHRLNMSESEVIDSLAPGYSYDYRAEHSGCYKAWAVVNDLVKAHNLQDQL